MPYTFAHVTDAERTVNVHGYAQCGSGIHTLSHVNKAHRQYFIHAIIINIYSFCCYWSVCVCGK